MALFVPTPADAAAALVVAYGEKHPGEGVPTENTIVLPLAQIMGEGSLSRYFAGTNNLGAMHATQSFANAHAADVGYGMVAFLDHGPQGAYVSRMAVYPSMTAGARAVLDLVERMVDLAHVSDATDYARQLYTHGYYEGFSSPVTPLSGRAAAAAANAWTAGDLANIDAYARLISANVPGAVTAFHGVTNYPGDPSASTVGPPFALLADRLTPSESYAPHTLDHARALLGAAADDPPAGAISIADALAAPGGEGVWLFGRGTPAPALQQESSSSSVLRPIATGVAIVAGGVLVAILAREAGFFARWGTT